MLNLTPDQRLRRALDMDTPSGCWLWTRPVDRNGYGYTRVDTVRWQAHVLAYVTWVGPIPDGLVLDHLCHDPRVCLARTSDCPHRRCCNPHHLEPVTQAVNMARSGHPNFMRQAQAVCGKGHSVTGDNVSLRADGRRKCRTCVNETARRSRARRAQ